MLLKLYQAGQPILRKPAQAVMKEQLATSYVQNIIDFMIDTLRDAPGVGLAAPQVGENLRIIIIEDKAKYHDQVYGPLLIEQGRKPVALKVIVNPEIELLHEDKTLYFEGCLSVEGYTAAVLRYQKIQVHGLDRNGDPQSFIAENWLARIIQHEIDHLNATLYVDHMKPASFMTIKNYSLLWKKALQSKIEHTFSID